MVTRYWPLEAGRILTSPFGPRNGGFHYGADFGFPGGSGGRPVFAIQSGTVQYAGPAQGYGGGDAAGLAGWLVVDSDDSQGGGCLEYGHIVRLPHIHVGTKVTAGQHIAHINPDSRTNGGTAPHLHLSDMPDAYNPATKQNPLPRLRGALDPGGAVLVAHKETTVQRPDFNEYPIWSPSGESRAGTKVDLFLLHTEEGGPTKGGADRLARWLADPRRQVSYHYSISEDPDDRGVTVVDVRDTDTASWSALSANRRSINLVFAGSRAAWTRADWLRWAPRAIDVAAYLAAQDCKKYNIPRRVIKPPYGPPGGVSDHRYVTRYLKDGSHTDVGDGFPWDVFEAAFLKYTGQAVTPPTPTPPPAPPAPQPPSLAAMTDRQLLEEIYRRVTK